MEVETNDNDNDDDSTEVEEENPALTGRRSARARSNSASAAASKENIGGERRTSSRATKFTSSMKEPSETIRDLLKDTNHGGNKTNTSSDKAKATPTKSLARRKGSETSTETEESDDDENPKKQAKSSKRGKNAKEIQRKQPAKQNEPSSPHKSPARRHRKSRLSISHIHPTQSDSDASDDSTVEESEDDDEDEEEEEPFKIQRIIASRTEPRNAWAKIGATMQTSEIEYGSRWVQDKVDDDDDTFEERFLVKWSDMSYLHVSWETESDLLELAENAKNYLSTFFRKSSHGLLFSSDERCDGDYFDPGWTQVDRVLEVHFPEECPVKSVKDEDKVTNEDLGICLDKKDKAFENGLGRQFLVKWGNSPYAESTFEYERDLILNEVDYKDQLKDFHRRRKKVCIVCGGIAFCTVVAIRCRPAHST